MTDVPPPGAAPGEPPRGTLYGANSAEAPRPGTSSAFSDDRQMATIIYILFLIAPFAFHITGVVGLILAYVNRDTAPEWLKSHYTFQIHTFWISLLYLVVAGLLCFMLIGFLLLPVVLIWFVVRCALGISRLVRSEAYPTPRSWWI